MRTDILEREKEILQWIEEGQSKAYMARQLNCNPKTINPILERLNIQYDGNKALKDYKNQMDVECYFLNI